MTGKVHPDDAGRKEKKADQFWGEKRAATCREEAVQGSEGRKKGQRSRLTGLKKKTGPEKGGAGYCPRTEVVTSAPKEKSDMVSLRDALKGGVSILVDTN